MHVANLQFMWQNRPFERCLSQELFAILPNASNASAHFQTEGRCAWALVRLRRATARGRISRRRRHGGASGSIEVGNVIKKYNAMQYIGVFLSSRDEVPASYREAAEQVGQWIGETRRTLVYGGSGVGLMEVLARAAKQSGARVFGIVPQFVVDRHIVSETLDVEIRTAALSDRKTVMIDRSDVLVALPGGVGTLDEVFTVLAARTANETHKRVVLYDVDGCWQPLIALLDQLVEQGLYGADQRKAIGVATNIAELEELCS